MGSVIDIEKNQPHVAIPTPGAVHCYPVSALRDYAEGRSDIELPKEVLRVIVGEWLNEAATNSRMLMYFLLDEIGERNNAHGETEYLYSCPKPIRKALAGGGSE